MSSESTTAFYKGVKFWIVLLLAALIAALFWRMWLPNGPAESSEAEASSPGGVSGDASGSVRLGQCVWVRAFRTSDSAS